MSLSGKIIWINGASSSGKTTLAKALQANLDEPFWHFSIDHIRDSGMLPTERIKRKEFAWRAMRPAFFDGFYRCLPALAGAGNNLLIEHIVETEEGLHQMVELLRPFDVFLVGVHCPLPELERRETERGDRQMGSARQDYAITHSFLAYDIEVDSTQPLAQNVEAVIAAWKSRTSCCAFDKMSSKG